ncbi:hypothetical protein HDU76_001999 [Blyttiomyces sp. JEL0837]|nr:hypothetical protein HDU76_001999 [Blyttiomyces sp. JEL0837]
MTSEPWDWDWDGDVPDELHAMVDAMTEEYLKGKAATATSESLSTGMSSSIPTPSPSKRDASFIDVEDSLPTSPTKDNAKPIDTRTFKKKSERSKIIVKNVKTLESKWRKGWLSVSDFSSLQWCEQQVYYETTTGMKRVQTDVMKKGSVIHEKLEREIKEVVEIPIHTKEDAWALKFVNMIVNIHCLVHQDLAREIPVFGRVGNFLIHGIIDQIERRDVASQSSNIPPTVVSSAAADQSLKDIIGKDREETSKSSGVDDSLNSSSTTSVSIQSPVWEFILSDTKTRSVRSLPTPSRSKPSRLQILLYRKLWNDMVEGLFDSSFFIEKMCEVGSEEGGCSSYPQLCSQSKEENSTILEAPDKMVDSSSLGDIISPRKGGTGQFRRKGSTNGGHKLRPDQPFSEDIQMHVNQVLNDIVGISQSHHHDAATTLSETETPSHSPSTSLNSFQTCTTLRQLIPIAISTAQMLPKLSETCELHYRFQGDSSVLGVVKEQHDEEWLSAQLERAVLFWEGKVDEINGVEDIEELRWRCGPCRFIDVCDWRAKKHSEIVSKGV